MGYLFFQIWLWLIVSFALGWFAHWFLSCYTKETTGRNKNTDAIESIPTESDQS